MQCACGLRKPSRFRQGIRIEEKHNVMEFRMSSRRVKMVLLLTSFVVAVVVVSLATSGRAPDAKQTRPPIDESGFVSHTETITVDVPMQFLYEWRGASS